MFVRIKRKCLVDNIYKHSTGMSLVLLAAQLKEISLRQKLRMWQRNFTTWAVSRSHLEIQQELLHLVIIV